MSDGSKYVITLEMQNYYFNGLNLNKLIYGNELRKKTNLPVLIIVLLIKDSEINSTDFEYDDNESIYKELYDNVYVLCLDLYHIYYCLRRVKTPDLKGFVLTDEGNELIKLFLIRIWGTLSGDCNQYPNYYFFPKPLRGSKEIINIIELINISKNEEISQFYLQNKEKKLQKEESEINNYIEFLITEYLNNNDIKNLENPFPKVSPEFLIKICKDIMNINQFKNFFKLSLSS